MSLIIRTGPEFKNDFDKIFRWYLIKGGEEISNRFRLALDETIFKISRQPDLGRLRHFQSPKLHGLRSLGLSRPFGAILMFYRSDSEFLDLFRLMHGARHLSVRLVEPS